jgi:hypothetical protein
MRRSLGVAIALSLGLVLPYGARAAEPSSSSGPAVLSATPAGLLAEADAAVGAGDLSRARSLFEWLATAFPAAPEANEARRALRIVAVSAAL